MSIAVSQLNETAPRKRTVILFGGDISSGGGANRVVRDLATILSERLDFDTTVITSTKTKPSYAFSPSVRIEYHDQATSPKNFRRLIKEIGRRKPDYMISFWHWDNIRVALNSALSGQRSIVTEHTSWHHPPLRTRVARALTYRFAKAVCVLNPVEFDHYRRFLGNVVLLPNPVPALPSSAIAPKEKLIVAVGHLIDRKNFRDAILAMARSGLARDGWRLAIIGDGPERASLDQLILDQGLRGTAEIVAPTSDIAHWYARASVILVTSTIEVFSLVLAEAMSMAVVPLAYAADGPAYLLEAHPDLLVEPGDAARLGERLGQLCRSPDLQARGRAMSEVIRNRFSEDAIAEQWRTLLLN
jgi:glycosyltransferase involved in cell wall biosynthesis